MTDWDEIVHRHGPEVWRTAYRLLGDHTEAEDCFQETFLDALRLSRSRLVRHWSGLLRRLATARAIDGLRRRIRRYARESTVDCDMLVGSKLQPADNAVAAELSDRLRCALSQLPDRAAEIFCLHALEGWSYAEVAAELGISVDAVGVALHRARQQLQELLKPALAGRSGTEES